MAEIARSAGAAEADEVRLLAVLRGAYSSDSECRQNAEKRLKELEASPGLPTSLLQIVRNTQSEPDLQLAAAIFLKNEVKRHWQNEYVPRNYGESDKVYVRTHIFDCLVEMCENTLVRNMIEEALRLVALYDFPHKWPQILSHVREALQNPEGTSAQRLLCSLFALRRLTGKYELDVQANRIHLDEIVNCTFPLLIQLADKLTSPSANGVPIWVANPGKAMMMKLICCVYWSSTQVALAKGGQVSSTIDSWMGLMHKVLTTSLPRELLIGADGNKLESRACDSLEQLKTKKRAVQIVHRFFSRYGTDKGEYKAVGQQFISKWSCQFIECFLELFRHKASIEWTMTNRMQSLIFQYMSQAVEMSQTYKFLKSNVREMLSDHCFPLLCYTDEDDESWELDPVDFVRSQSDMLSAFAVPREAAVEFIQIVGRYRSRDFLDQIQQIAEAAIAQYAESARRPEGPSKEACRQKDGALQVLGSIANRLTSDKRKVPISTFLIQHVFPEIVGPNKFLRLRASWTAERFLFPSGTNPFACYGSKTLPPPKFSDPTNLVQAFRAMLQACGDPELPVRIQAGTSIKAFFSIAADYSDGVLRRVIVESLADVMLIIFALMNDMENEWVVATLQSLVFNFEEEVLPYAAQLTQALSNALVKFLVAEDTKQDVALDDGTDSLSAALSISETVISVLSSGDSAALKDTVQGVTLASHLAPLLGLVLHPENLDFLDDGLRILSLLVCHVPILDDLLWSWIERLHSAVCGGPAVPTTNLPEIFRDGWAPDYLNLMLPAIHNYLMRDPQGTKQRMSSVHSPPKSYLTLIFEMVSKGLDDNGDPDGPKHALLVLSYVFEAFISHQPQLSDFMKASLEIQWQYLNTNRPNKQTKTALVRSWSTMMLYDVNLFLQLLKEGDLTGKVFSLFNDTAICKTTEGKKLYVLALGQVLARASSAPNEVPLLVSQNVGDLAQKIVDQSKKLLESKANKDDSEADSDDSTGTLDSEEDLDENEDATALTDKGKLDEGGSDVENDDDDDDDDDSYESGSLADAVYCCSRLDAVDEVGALRDMIANNQNTFVGAVDITKLNSLGSMIAQELSTRQTATQSSQN